MDITHPFEAASPDPHAANGDNAQQTAEQDTQDRLGDEWSVGYYARRDMDRETTRYLSAATQLEVGFAQNVVNNIVGQPLRALAPAYGADVTVVARWAVDSVIRRSRRDWSLILIFISGGLLSWLLSSWTAGILAAIGLMFLAAWSVVALEYWKRKYRIVVRQMLNNSFDREKAPEARQQWVRDRISAIVDQRRGNLVVFRGGSAFVGSGERLSREHIVIDVSRGRKVKRGKQQKPQKFTNADVHAALMSAMKKIAFADIHVEERLFVNGRHIKKNRTLMPNGILAPPATYVSPSLLKEAELHPTPDARVYVCVEMPGWQGQLVVTLFARAVHVGGSLYIEWEYCILPPLSSKFLRIDRLYGRSLARQLMDCTVHGAKRFIPDLFMAPFQGVRDLRRLYVWKRTVAKQKEAIEQGQEFDYGASKSVREIASGIDRQHYFLRRDEIMYVLLSQQILVREVRAFLRSRDVSLSEFDIQVKAIKEETFKFYNVHLGDVSNSSVVIGDKSAAKNKASQGA